MRWCREIWARHANHALLHAAVIDFNVADTLEHLLWEQYKKNSLDPFTT